jgi:hypothetical protein
MEKISVNIRFVLSFVILSIIISNVSAVTCPFGIINESAPGSCGRYYDSNGDNLCDLSQEVITPYNPEQNVTTPAKSTKIEYYMWQIALVLTLIYISGLYLVKKKKISTIAHRKFWNILLLITFIITALSSIFVLLSLNYNISFSFPINVVFWHIEIGWAMIVISIFHTLWHFNYYKLKRL